MKHFKVLEDNENDFHVEPEQHFSSLIDLVEHYCTQRLNQDPPMGRPCKRVGQCPVSVGPPPQAFPSSRLCSGEIGKRLAVGASSCSR